MSSVYERQKKDPKTGLFIELPDARRKLMRVSETEEMHIILWRKAQLAGLEYANSVSADEWLKIREFMKHIREQAEETALFATETLQLNNIPEVVLRYINWCYYIMDKPLNRFGYILRKKKKKEELEKRK